MLVEKVSPRLGLETIQRAAELDVPFRLLEVQLESAIPIIVVSVHSFRKLLQHTEVCARGTAYEQQWLFFQYLLGRFPSVLRDIKIPSVLKIHGRALDQAELAAQCRDAFRRVDLGNICPEQTFGQYV